MSEQLRDFLAITTLAVAITSGATTLTVNSAANFPSSGTFDVRIDDEILTVTNVSGSIFTVTRAAGTPSTTAAAHAGNAVVRMVLTKRQLESLMTTLFANNQTGTSYTLVLGDAGLVVECNNGSAVTLTVPPNSSVAFPVGTVLEVFQQGAGQVTITAGVGVTIRSRNGLKLAGQYAVASLRKRATDEWVCAGDTTT